MNLLKGKLSYLLAALAVLGGGAAYYMGTIDGATALTMVWAGLSVFGLRRAIK